MQFKINGFSQSVSLFFFIFFVNIDVAIVYWSCIFFRIYGIFNLNGFYFYVCVSSNRVCVSVQWMHSIEYIPFTWNFNNEFLQMFESVHAKITFFGISISNLELNFELQFKIQNNILLKNQFFELKILRKSQSETWTFIQCSTRNLNLYLNLELNFVFKCYTSFLFIPKWLSSNQNLVLTFKLKFKIVKSPHGNIEWHSNRFDTFKM